MYISNTLRRVTPLELSEAPMGVINYYYFMAYQKNEAELRAREEEEKKENARKQQERNNRKQRNVRVNPNVNRNRNFMNTTITSDMIEDLEDEL